MNSLLKKVFLAGMLALTGCGKEDALYPHETPILSEQGNHIEIVAADSAITVDQAKALIHHYRANMRGYIGFREGLGQVILKVPWTGRYTNGRAYPIFIIFNEFPDKNDEHFIINDRSAW